MAKCVTATDEKFDPVASQPAYYVLIEASTEFGLSISLKAHQVRSMRL
jgi:hypothetical protein